MKNPFAKFRCSFLFTIALTCLGFTIQAQEIDDFLPKQNHFRIGLGASFIETTDMLYSTHIYKSVRANIQLGYSNKLKHGVFSTDLNVFLGTLAPKLGHGVGLYTTDTDINGTKTVKLNKLEIAQIGFNLETGYLHELSKMRTSTKALYLGGSLGESLTYTPGFLNIGVINYASFNVKSRFDYFLQNGKPITFALSVPAVSMVTRLPYHEAPGAPEKSDLGTFFSGNNHLETLNHFQNISFSVKYRWLVKKRIAFDITYEGSWMHYYKPEHLTQAGSQLSLGFNF